MNLENQIVFDDILIILKIYIFHEVKFRYLTQF
jgi:hypothetical protein